MSGEKKTTQNSLPLDGEPLLKRLNEMIEDVNAQNGTKEKMTKLQKYPDLRDFFGELMNPLQTTGITPAIVKKYMQKQSSLPLKKKMKISPLETPNFRNDNNMSIWNMLHCLYHREWTGNKAKEKVTEIIKYYTDYEDLILKIINKDLEIRLGVKQINKVFPDLINDFSVALANDFTKAVNYFDKSLTNGQDWIISRKYDGLRCILMAKNGLVKAYSRKGNPLPALSPLEKLLAPWAQTNWVLDGEICVIDHQTGQELFQEAVSRAKRKSILMTDYRFYAFDFLNLEEFESGTSPRLLSDRLKQLKHLEQIIHQPEYFRVFEYIEYTEENFLQWQVMADKHNWEGLMLRLDTFYKGTRSNDILKFKKFQREEFVVVGVEFGDRRVIDADNGLEKSETMLKSAIIEYKNNYVYVGSGFTEEQRRKYYLHPELIKGRMISVQYFEETKDKDTGKPSLRFPTVKCVYDGSERDM